MKTLKQIFGEVYGPDTKDGKAFVHKHVTVKTDDANGNGDDVFQATNVKTIKRKAERHGYDSGEDEKVYESEDAQLLLDFINEEQLDEMDKSMAYATGTKRAMQMTGDKPPLEKSTITKAHKIAKAMLRKEDYSYETLHQFLNERYDDLTDEDVKLIESLYDEMDEEDAELFLDLLNNGELDTFLDHLSQELEG
ncbi:hypothetical protein EBR43_05000 [bacterium]|nr:hypothetical protein [bacterium]